MGTSKTIAVKITRKMHAILEDGAKRTGLSLAEFTDQVLRAKTEGSFMAQLGQPKKPEHQAVKGKRTGPGWKYFPNIDMSIWEG